MALAAVELDDPDGYGRVMVGRAGTVERIVEHRDATADEKRVALINAGLYAFDVAWLRGALPRLTPSMATQELYLTQLVEIAGSDGRPAVVIDEPEGADWQSELAGINDRSDLAEIQLMLQYAIVQRHMEAGVTFADPSAVTVDATVEFGEDVMIEANVSLRGTTRLERDVIVRAGSQLVDAQVGERSLVWASVIEIVDHRAGCAHRSLQPPARRLCRRRRGRDRQLCRAEERALRRPFEAASLQLPG